MYNGSKEHIENLNKARKILINNKIGCSYCGTLRTKANIKKHEKTCYLNPIIKKLCIVCDSPVKNPKSSKTCGYACSNKHFRSGPDNGNWKEEVYKTTCFLHHKKKCVICEESNIVEVHHLDENHNNNSPDNLIPLCPTHHQYWHSRYKSLVEDKVLEYISKWKSEN